MEKKLENLKIAVVHDHLAWPGGGERTALLMAIGIDADFICAYTNDNTFPDYQKLLGPRLIPLSRRLINIRGLRFFYIRWLYFHNRNLFKKYDVLIASGQSAMEAVAFYGSSGATKILYNHTQPRRVYDLYEISKNMYPLAMQPLYTVFARMWKVLYEKALLRIDVNIANSVNVRTRAIKYTNRDVNYIVWPPILTDKFKHLGNGDYFLSWARTDEAKRIELIVEAFQKMPDKKLVIASGGPRLEIVKAMAKGFSNIEVLGWVDDQKLFQLVGNCQAAIYIPIDEDAGMTPLEANSAGKPVLGVREGGLIETIIEGVTGLLVKENPSADDLIKAVKIMTPEWCLSLKDQCIQNARKYDKESFIEKIRAIINDHDPRKPILGIDASRWDDPRFPGENRRTGVEVYAYHLIKHLIPLAQKAGMRVRLYAQHSLEEIPLQIQKILPRQKGWTRRLLNNELKTSLVDYFFTPAYYIPKNAPKNSYATIHDVIFKSNPEKYSFSERLKQNFVTKLNLKRAKKILTVSEISKKEIIKYYGYPTDNIFSASMGTVSKAKQADNKERDLMILYIGRIEKKKSVDVLIKAFSRLLTNHPDLQLTLAGMDGNGAEEIDELVKSLGIENNTHKLGYISEEEKDKLLSNAQLLVHPSSLEGSCFPLFEAWGYNIPAIVSDTPIFREIADDACLFFKSADDQDLSNKIEKLLNDQTLRNELTEKGRLKLAQMSWDKTGATILNVITNNSK